MELLDQTGSKVQGDIKMKLSKVELYIWGFNDERDADPIEVLDYVKDRSKRDIAFVIGDVSTTELPDPVGDNFPLNKKGEALTFCRSIEFGREIMPDITAPKFVEIQIKDDGKVVWINTENGCQLRACQIKVLELNDHRTNKQAGEPE
jgi:hypothetical protein